MKFSNPILFKTSRLTSLSDGDMNAWSPVVETNWSAALNWSHTPKIPQLERATLASVKAFGVDGIPASASLISIIAPVWQRSETVQPGWATSRGLNFSKSRIRSLPTSLRPSTRCWSTLGKAAAPPKSDNRVMQYIFASETVEQWPRQLNGTAMKRLLFEVNGKLLSFLEPGRNADRRHGARDR